MKKVVLLGLLFIGLNSFAQGTTQKEFNYASKGYADDLAMGKDIISGYSIEKASTTNSKVLEAGTQIDRVTTIYKLMRSSNNSVAALIVQEKRLDNNNVVYSCLPNAMADGVIWGQAQDLFWKKTQAQKCSLDGQAFAYNWNIMKLLSIAMSK